MSDTYSPELRRRLRDLMARKGTPVEINPRFNPSDRWNFESEVSTYGWTDFKAQKHAPPESWEAWRNNHADLGTCKWVVPEGVLLRERTYSEFAGTGTDNNEAVGINVYGCHCACGQYTDVVLRYEGSLADTIRELTAPTEPIDDPGIRL